jgi:uncharacterized protein YcbX
VRLAEIWRYPVKSMGGEPLDETWLTADGIPGDRVVHVEDARGRVITSRSRPRLLLHRGSLGDDGQPLVDGRRWVDDDVGRDVEAAAGPGCRLVEHRGLDRFDILPISLATDGAIDSLGYDRRRFRPNLLLGQVPGLSEREWEGRRIQIGGAVLRAVALRPRCIMTTFDPDTAVQDREVLLRVHRELGGKLSLDCEVVQPGRVAAGDLAEVD